MNAEAWSRVASQIRGSAVEAVPKSSIATGALDRAVASQTFLLDCGRDGAGREEGGAEWRGSWRGDRLDCAIDHVVHIGATVAERPEGAGTSSSIMESVGARVGGLERFGFCGTSVARGEPTTQQIDEEGGRG